LIRSKSNRRLDQGDQYRDGDLPTALPHDRARVCDHEEHEQLVHRPRDWRDLRQHRLVKQRGAQTIQEQEARDVREGDVNDPHTSRDHEAKDPDHEIRRHIVAPLMAEHRNTVRRGKQQGSDRKVGRVPEMIIAILQDVLRRDREEGAEREWPERAALWLEQQRKTNSADVRALEIDDTSAHEPRE
jgi:hypothetical protein